MNVLLKKFLVILGTALLISLPLAISNIAIGNHVKDRVCILETSLDLPKLMVVNGIWGLVMIVLAISIRGSLLFVSQEKLESAHRIGKVIYLTALFVNFGLLITTFVKLRESRNGSCSNLFIWKWAYGLSLFQISIFFSGIEKMINEGAEEDIYDISPKE